MVVNSKIRDMKAIIALLLIKKLPPRKGWYREWRQTPSE